MTSILEIRKMYPQYEGHTDGDLLMALHRKHYSHMHPRDFLRSIEGGANAHVTIKNPKMRDWWRQEVSKPRPGETEQQARKRLNGSLSDIAPNTGGRLAESARSTLQGMTFGYGDEIVAAGHAALSPDVTYDQALGAERARLAQGEKNSPKTALASEVGGGVLTGLVSAPYAVGRGLLGTMGRGVAIGGFEGALYGSGKGEGLGDRAKKAAQFGILGGAFGGAAPAAISGVKAGIKAPLNWVGSSLDVGNLGRAKSALGATLRKAGMSPEDVRARIAAAAADGQSEFRTMDALGRQGQRTSSGLVRAGGDAGDSLGDFLATRQAGQGDRIGTFVDDAFETRGTTASKTKQAMAGARDTAADAAYGAARSGAGPVDVRGAVAVIDDRIGGMSGSNIKGDGVDAKLARYRNRLIADPAPNGEISRELSDFNRVLGVKQDIGDDIGAAVRAGRKNEARELRKLAKALDAALEAASPAYRSANDDFAAASRVIDAVDEGATMQSRGRASDNVDLFSGMTPEQQAAARVGYGDSVLTKLERNASPTANKAKLLTSPKATQESASIANDPDKLARRLARENEMWSTQNRALGGSRTADNLADIDTIERGASGIFGALRSTGDLNFGTAVAHVFDALSPHIKGQNESVRQIIADAMMSQDPVAALQRAVDSDMTAQQINRILESAARASARSIENKSGRLQGLLSSAQ